MRLKKLGIFLILMLISTLVMEQTSSTKAQNAETSAGLYFGVDVAFESLNETIRIIDEVSS